MTSIATLLPLWSEIARFYRSWCAAVMEGLWSPRALPAWLRQRYNEMEAEVLRDWGKNADNQVCTAAGGHWSGVSCYTPAGRPFNPTQERAN